MRNTETVMGTGPAATVMGTPLATRPRSGLRRMPWLATLLWALSACSSLPPPESASPARAAEWAARGEHASAAREYDALAAGRGADADDYRLLATEQWLAAREAANAEISLRSLLGPLDPARRQIRDLLAIEIAMLQGAYASAWQSLGTLSPPKGDAQTERFHALRQRIAIAVGEPVEAIRSSRQRESIARDSRQVAALRAELLKQLRTAITSGARFDANLAGRDRIARGWLEAADLAAKSLEQARETAAETTAAWRRRYPGHPAAIALGGSHRDAPADQAPLRRSLTTPAAAATVVAKSTPGDVRTAAGGHVAVLLPLSGRHENSGTELRDGLLSAFYASGGDPKIPLRFYDTQRESLTEILRRAQQQGAVFIIGPLLRDEVADIATLQPNLPVLALNALPADARPASSVVQLSLSPEDEARAVAQRALAEGRKRAVALVPQGDWGTRVLQAFERELQQGGGRVLAVERIDASDPSTRDLTTAIQSALRIGQSLARHRQLQAELDTPLAFQPRRRGDVDLLFVPAQAALLRQVRPQLRFQAVADIPTYSVADAWNGLPDKELAELMFVDMPWLLSTADPREQAFRERARQAFGDKATQSRLFALGHDAWRVYQALRADWPAGPIAGLSGELSLAPSGQIRRGVRWATLDAQGALLPPDSASASRE